MEYTDTISPQFDVIVVGAGHAGNEAAMAAARMGSRTLLITLTKEKIGHMPCNPAVGGIGKGHIVFEIAALNGLMPQLCTQTYLQARMLNTRKGPAVQGLRLQIDKVAYNRAAAQAVDAMPGLTVLTGMVEQVLLDGNRVVGVTTREGGQYLAPCVVLTTGTFLSGVIHTGQVHYAGGRQGEEAVTGLAQFLKSLPLRMGRLKTGTPPRLLRRSINFDVMDRQGSDDLPYLFEFAPHRVVHKMDCHITSTNIQTHDIIRKNFHLSPIFTGHITGKPPRYCPSIEDKISRFAHKDSHHIFVEPESASLDEIYPNGLSTSLPLPAQLAFIRTIKGFEEAEIVRPGYAIEYDYVHPQQLDHTLKLKDYQGLYLAGQINGTTGYEEAAGQGIIAGINAHLAAHGQEPYILDRERSYIGVMIDDLVTLGADEPYRMFTSRSERRLTMRQDNVFGRFAPDAYRLGLISKERYDDIMGEQQVVHAVTTSVRASKTYPQVLHAFGDQQEDVVYGHIDAHAPDHRALSPRARLQIYAELLYGPYMEREQREIDKFALYKDLVIPQDFVYSDIPGLSKELQQKLSAIRPGTIGQAALVQGMTPAALSLLIFKARPSIQSRSARSLPASAQGFGGQGRMRAMAGEHDESGNGECGL